MKLRNREVPSADGQKSLIQQWALYSNPTSAITAVQSCASYFDSPELQLLPGKNGENVYIVRVLVLVFVF